MTTLTLQIDNPSVLNQLKEAIKSIHGVRIVASSNPSLSMDETDVPNATTLSAMQEAREGIDAGVVSVEDMQQFIASMQ